MYLWLERRVGALYQLLRIRLARIKAHYYDTRLGIETKGHFSAREDPSLNQDMHGYISAFYGITRLPRKI